MPDTGLQASWNPITDLQLLFQYHFMHNAFLAGTIAAVVAGAIGYYMVLRAQSFAGHALAHVGFAGATGALLFGLSPIVGLLAVGIGSALGMGALEERQGGRQVGDSVAIAAVFTFGLGLGLLFLQLYAGQAENAYAILFGAVLGISDSDVVTIALTAAVTLVALAAIARPLLFASIDPDVAMARGVPVRALSVGFLVLLAFAVAEAVQVVGTLLIFALLITPAATAQRLTARPSVAIGLSVLLALLFTWLGIAVAYFAPYSVVGFYVTTLAFGTYTVVRLPATKGVRRLMRRHHLEERMAA
jgi:zinc/manganese transport system permease protein